MTDPYFQELIADLDKLYKLSILTDDQLEEFKSSFDYVKLSYCTDKSIKVKYSAKFKLYDARVEEWTRKLLLKSNDTGGEGSHEGPDTEGHDGHKLTALEKKTRDDINDTSKQSLKTLQDARSTLYDTEKIAKDTINRLDAQNAQIKNMSNTVKEINDKASGSNRMLARMTKWWRG